MPIDHPDGTRPIVISRADIQTPIDIQHQTTNVKTNFKEQSVGVHSEPEWESKAGKFKSIIVIAVNVAVGVGEFTEYTIPGGKIYYITHITGSIYGYAAADCDKEQICHYNLQIAAVSYLYVGGNGGFSITLPTPFKAIAGQVVKSWMFNKTNHACSMYAVVGGYEI